MYNYRWRLSQLIKFYLQADTISKVHSPFAYKILSYILDEERTYYDFRYIEEIRSLALENNRELNLVDFGAGSTALKEKQRKISKIAEVAASSPKQCRELFRLVQYTKPSFSIELGTSLGISTAYIAKGYTGGKVVSFEGDPSLSKIAKLNLKSLQVKNVEIRTGSFEETLPIFLGEVKSLDFIFMDGHHTYDATIRYFGLLKSKLHDGAVLVVDDIYWSMDMLKAWKEIIQDPLVTLSINLFYYGIIFFKKSILEKTHLQIVDQAFKPWN